MMTPRRMRRDIPTVDATSPSETGRRIALVAASILALALAGPALGRPARVTTLVLNGTHRIGLARRVSDTLASRGIDTKHLRRGWVADAPQPARLTTIFVDRRQTDASAAARRLHKLFGRAAVVKPMPLQIRRYADRAGRPMTVVVVGSSYRGLS